MNEKQLILSYLEGEAEVFREMVDIYKTKAMALALNIAFIEDHNALDRIIRHLKLTFAAERPSSTTGPASTGYGC